MEGLVGIIPAGGLGMRMQPFPGPKELLTVGYSLQSGSRPVPRVVSEYTLESMKAAGCHQVVVTLSKPKLDIARFFGGGNAYGLQLAYVLQETADGMASALDLAYPWVQNRTVLMGMPDTIIRPADSFVQILALHRENASDLTLGVFPTLNPSSFAPVRWDPATRRVLEIQDKPKSTTLMNTWGMAAWSPRFTELLHTFVGQGTTPGREYLLSDAFGLALQQGLSVHAHYFEQGEYFDIGTPEGLMQARAEFELVQLTDIHGARAELKERHAISVESRN